MVNMVKIPWAIVDPNSAYDGNPQDFIECSTEAIKRLCNLDIDI